ncbi:MAG: 2-oxoacid:acceptor oxidoreductase family protein, partial [Actinobacteria bacterium]|nr:2-oxoacid:acceptor oxidoreductase family protein [Actinomycetota bacterium]
MLEAARCVDFLKPGADVFVNRYRIAPPSVNAGEARYPEEADINRLLETRAGRVVWVDASAEASGLGNPALAGVILLGLVAADLKMEPQLWLSVIERLVPARFVQLNLDAFRLGFGMAH